MDRSEGFCRCGLLFLPGLAAVVGDPDFRGRSGDSSMLKVGEFQADDVAGQDGASRRWDDASPVVAGVSGVIERSSGTAGPDVRASRGNSTESRSGSVPLKGLVGVFQLSPGKWQTTAAKFAPAAAGFALTSTVCHEFPWSKDRCRAPAALMVQRGRSIACARAGRQRNHLGEVTPIQDALEGVAIRNRASGSSRPPSAPALLPDETSTVSETLPGLKVRLYVDGLIRIVAKVEDGGLETRRFRLRFVGSRRKAGNEPCALRIGHSGSTGSGLGVIVEGVIVIRALDTTAPVGSTT